MPKFGTVSGQERGTRGRVTIYRLLSHTNACMAASLEWKWCVLTICKRCRLESITELSTRRMKKERDEDDAPHTDGVRGVHF